MPKTLFLILEGPLQSWGERARWSVRDTAFEPTKSGVVGLLGCALGINRDAALSHLSRQLRMGVRCDRPGFMISDYHTIVGGVLSAEGKVKINATTKQPETVVTRRQYLCDACFVVALQANDDSLLEQLKDAVQSPVWPVYLGRKSCPPARPVFAGWGDYLDLETALCRFDPQDRATWPIRAVVECPPGQGSRRRDELDARSRRSYLPRYTRDFLVSKPQEA